MSPNAMYRLGLAALGYGASLLWEHQPIGWVAFAIGALCVMVGYRAGQWTKEERP